MKKDKYVIGFTLLLIVIGAIFMVLTNNISYAADTSAVTYADFGVINSLDTEYSNSVLFYTKDTKFIPLKRDNTYVDSDGSMGKICGKEDCTGVSDALTLPPRYYLQKNGEELILQITNCAVDANGNMLDAVIKLDQANIWTKGAVDKSKRNVRLIMWRSHRFLNSQKDVRFSNSYESHIGFGEPIKLGLGATEADVRFTMTYYKSGTVSYDKSTDTVSGTKASISKINTFFSDLDIAVKGTDHESHQKAGEYKSYIFNGEEGFRPITPSTIYYNKNEQSSLSSKYTNYNKLQEVDGGLATLENRGTEEGQPDCKENKTVCTNAVWYQDSAFMTTETSDATLSFQYGGTGCGIHFSFLSPYPYVAPNPIKSIENKKVEYHPGESYKYILTQYIPNNYYAEKLKFNDIFKDVTSGQPIIPDTTLYSSFKLSDNFSSISKYITIKNNEAKVIDESGVDFTKSFDISYQNNVLTATAHADLLKQKSFYGHTYKLSIPVTINQTGVDVKKFTNIGLSELTPASTPNNPINNPTNPVETDIYHNIIVKHLEEETEKELAPEITEKKKSGDIYETESSSLVPEKYELVKIPDNAKGTMKDTDITVIYYYKPIERSAKLFKQDSDTNKHVAGAELVVYDEEDNKVAKWITKKDITSCNIAVVGESDGCEVYEELETNKTYKVVEEKTPVGYATSSPVTFTTDSKGNSKNIVIENQPIKVCISVVDTNNNPIVGMEVTMDYTSGNKYQIFTSEKKEVCYNYVPVDDYSLEETKVVSNYEKADILKIKVKDTPSVQHFKIVNQLIVPKTSLESKKIYTIIVFALSLIGLGTFGVFVYKNKKQKN